MSPAPTQLTITGLQPGDSVRVRAVTASGPGEPSGAVTVVGPPQAPVVTAASWSGGTATFAVAAPPSDGGSPVTGYQASVSGGTWTAVTGAPGTVTLTVPVGGTVAFRALNAHGAGTATAAATVATHTATRTYGDETDFVVPAGVTTLTVEMYGGAGGGGGYGGMPTHMNRGSASKPPRKVTGTLAVTPGETLGVYAGQGGEWGHPQNAVSAPGTNPGGAGGLNALGDHRGGSGGSGVPGTYVGGGGGGAGAATVLRRGTTSLAVASGGPGGCGASQLTGSDNGYVVLTTTGHDGLAGANAITGALSQGGAGGGAGAQAGGKGGTTSALGVTAGYYGSDLTTGLTGAAATTATGRISPYPTTTVTDYRGPDGAVTLTWVQVDLP